MNRKLVYEAKALPQEQFVPAPIGYKIIDVRVDQPGNPVLTTWQSPANNLIGDLSASTRNQPDRPSLRLVEVYRSANDRNSITHSSFHELLSHFHISNEALLMIEFNVLGFRHFPHQDDDSKVYSCYLNNVPYMLIWSFDPKKQRTQGIILCTEESNRNRFADFRKVLKMNMELVGDPLLLPTIMALLDIHGVHRRVSSMRMKVRGIEATFGFSTWTSLSAAHHSVGISGTDSQELTMYTKSISAALVEIGDTVRRLKLLALLLESLNDKEIELIKDIENKSALGHWQEFRQQLRREARSAEIQNDYLENRARNQFTVLFNLINQKDASTNIEIAARAKEDSSAMKTIAIMTMVFLPGTFLAALFAVPSLQWTADSVVTRRFWVYWAFMIPMTVAVLAIWAAITVWQQLVNYVTKASKKSLIAKSDGRKGRIRNSV